MAARARWPGSLRARAAALLLLAAAEPLGARRLQTGITDLEAMAVSMEAPLDGTAPESNLQQIDNEPYDATILVYAGPLYPSLKLRDNSASPSLGPDKTGVLTILVKSDVTACTTDTPSEMPYPPFDGSTAPDTASPKENIWSNVKFPRSGDYRICYRKELGGPFDVLPQIYNVMGAHSESVTYWCIWVQVGLQDEWECKVKIFGRGADVTWRASIAADTDDCATAFDTPFENKLSEVTMEDGYQIHNFGKRNQATSLSIWKVCYCPGFDGDNGNAHTIRGDPIVACDKDAVTDFVQEVGMIVLITGTTISSMRTVVVYPTLLFAIEFECGFNQGGCSGNTGSRYKIVRDSEYNSVNYFEENGGCRTYPQVGEQLSPANCLSPADCQDFRDESPLSKLKPTFHDIQMDATYKNRIMVPKHFDVCYCDSDCFSNANWFKVFDFTVFPFDVKFVFTIDVTDPADAFTPSLLGEPPVVNTKCYITIFTDSNMEDAQDGKTASFTLTGDKTREMKILPDPLGLVTRDTCLEGSQSTLHVSNHICTEVTDCDSPSYSSFSGHIYGDLDGEPNIKIQQSGWSAICYCDQTCNEVQNWVVAGRLMVAGPRGDQTWVFANMVAFSLAIEGVGLSSTNYARVISGTLNCGETDPIDDEVYGPSDHPTLLQSGENTGIKWLDYDELGRGVRVDFHGSHGLRDGDLLTISEVRSNTLEPDNTYEEEMINTAHVVSLVCDDVIDDVPCYAVTIPIYFVGGFPSLDLANSVWVRSSQELFSDIRAVVAGNFKVCWSLTNNAANGDFVGTAGTLVITEPPLMEAKLALTSVEPGAVAPIILSFTTNDKGAYKDTPGPMQLRIVFQDSSFLQPADRFLVVPTSPDEDSDEVHERNQAVCGLYILELWSDDPNGFPHPDGCYMRLDTTDTSATAKQLWEVYLVFSPKNGLRPQKSYQVVMNAQSSEKLSMIEPGDGAVHIWSMNDVDAKPYDVLELGKAFPQKNIATVIRDEDAGDPTFQETTGFRIVQPSNPALETGGLLEVGHHCAADAAMNQCGLCYDEAMCGNFEPGITHCVAPIDQNCPNADEAALQFSLAGKGATGSIKALSVVRIFLTPLTQWWIQERCSTTCLAQEVGDDVFDCGGDRTAEPTCEVESVVGGLVIGESDYHVNTLKVTLPPEMTPITSTISHTIVVKSLRLPSGGFVPQLFPVELQKKDGEAPHYWNTQTLATNGIQLFMQPKVLVASIVVRPGDGNDHPFRGDAGNLLYVKLIAGTTFFSRDSQGVQLTFTLPMGYTCNMAGESLPVPDNLGVLGRTQPNTRGLLGPNGLDEGYWSSQAGREDTPPFCFYNLEENAVWYAGSTVYLAIDVDNPTAALSQNEPENQWKLDVVAKDGTMGWKVPDAATVDAAGLEYLTKSFSGDVEEGYAHSIAVLGQLSNEIIFPTNWALGAQNFLMVFFQTEQEVGLATDAGSQIWVEAPEGYDFGLYCMVKHLDPGYYVLEPDIPTMPIPTGPLIMCGGRPIKAGPLYDRAVITTTARLLKDSIYGFQLRVTNPQTYDVEMRNEWKIVTMTLRGEGVDGSFTSVRFNAQDHANLPYSSWSPYTKHLDSEHFQVAIPDLRPTAAMGNAGTKIIVFPVKVTVQTEKNVRILAPAGYRWAFTQAEFKYRAASSGAPDDEVVPGADRDFPLSVVPTNPIVEPFNKLTIDYLKEPFYPGFAYGFISQIMVPAISPSSSPNYFVLELGYDENEAESRTEAAVTPALLVRSLINGAIAYKTNIKSRENFITFSVQVVTPLPRDGGLVFTGPPEFLFEPECSPKAQDNSPELPYDSSCVAVQELGSLIPMITITAGPSGIPASMYKLALKADNPSSVRGAGQEGTWLIQSFQVVSEQTLLDAPTHVPSFRVNDQMLTAGLVQTQLKPCKFLEGDEQLLLLPEENCDFPDWQYHRANRNDQPAKESSVILYFMLQAAPPEGDVDVYVHAPMGFEFANECHVETRGSHVFYADNPSSNVPPGFSEVYSEWPETAIVGSSDPDNAWVCGRVGVSGRTAKLTVQTGLKGRYQYIFRVSIAKNPLQTPENNAWLLEVGQETSQDIEGYPIFAFAETKLVPGDVAMSERHNPTPQPAEIFFIPFNGILAGGRLMIQAPSGFRIETECRAKIEVVNDPDDQPTTPAPLIDPSQNEHRRRRAEYLVTPAPIVILDDPEVTCMGDINPSNNAQVFLPVVMDCKCPEDDVLSAKNKLVSGQKYKLTIEVANPQSVSASRPWKVASYADNSLESLMDESMVEGYQVTYRINTFTYEDPATKAGTYKILLRFQMSFPEQVMGGDRIILDAPYGFVLNDDGMDDCMTYRHLSGFLTRTIPKCGANRMLWSLVDQILPAGSLETVSFETVNPPNTPDHNFFRVQHIKPDDSVYASRQIKGFLILPQLKEVNIYAAPTLNAPIQEAIGSSGTVVIKFVAESVATHVDIRGFVENSPFDFGKVSTPMSLDPQCPVNRDGEIQALCPDTTRFVGKMVINRFEITQVTLYGVTNPAVPGISLWDITTMNSEEMAGYPDLDDRKDQKLEAAGFEILGRVSVKSTSSVQPNFYGTNRGIINFNMESSVTLYAGDTISIMKPPEPEDFPGTGYRFFDKSLLVKRFVVSDIHGVDPSGEAYLIIIKADIPAGTEAAFSVEAKLPDEQQTDMRWLVQVFGANDKPKASNDLLFGGFLLVGEIPFFVVPQMKTPGAENKLTLTIDRLEYPIVGQNEVRVEGQAPFGFVFAASCLGSLSMTFSKCTGQSNKFTLVSASNTVRAGVHEIVLKGFNAPDTPSFNVWKLKAFIDAETQFVTFSEYEGFAIESMPVTMVGNDQLGMDGPIFFTFTAARTAERKATIIVEAPRRGGVVYELNCKHVYQIGLPKMPSCLVQPGKKYELTLVISNATIVSEVEYTFGVGVLNPGEAPASAGSNLWAVTLKDREGAVIDSNRNIKDLRPGPLVKFPVQTYGFGWSEVSEGSISRIRVDLLFTKYIEPGTVSQIQIVSPDGVMFSDPDGAIVSPEKFPLISTAPFTAAGNMLRVSVDTSEGIDEDLYGIIFDVKNPTRLPSKNVWVVYLIYKQNLLFTSAMRGYSFNEPSPMSISAPQDVSGAQLLSVLLALLYSA